MSGTTPKKTLLKGSPIRKEGVAGAAITPGMLIDFDVNGELVPHATATGFASKYFAQEQDFLGKDIDTAYADGDIVQYNVCPPGTEIYALLEASADAEKGEYLESASGGLLQVYTNGTIIARALEDKDNSAGTAAVRIKVEVV
ncbi:MAG: hypothetical protein GX163_05690 [Bacteroidetes bacterium]|jgi:hypothetical protein|nr:hypothetical protein [Bacteroidota bacterium]